VFVQHFCFCLPIFVFGFDSDANSIITKWKPIYKMKSVFKDQNSIFVKAKHGAQVQNRHLQLPKQNHNSETKFPTPNPDLDG
jgi:hypothetical protein